MKKNAMLKIAAVLLVAVLLTTCAISSTFAKYTTDGTNSDEARVAKFGVTVENIEGTLFDLQDTETGVLTTAEKKLVAPGTGNSWDLSAALSGTPEVDVKVTTSAAVTISGTWTIDTNGAEDGGEEFYCPLVFTISGTDDPISGLDYDNAAAFEAALEAAMTDSTGKTYEAGENLAEADDLTLEIAWEWAFDGTGEQTDAKDTLLGDLAVTADQGIKVEVTRTVVQID